MWGKCTMSESKRTFPWHPGPPAWGRPPKDTELQVPERFQGHSGVSCLQPPPAAWNSTTTASSLHMWVEVLTLPASPPSAGPRGSSGTNWNRWRNKCHETNGRLMRRKWWQKKSSLHLSKSDLINSYRLMKYRLFKYLVQDNIYYVKSTFQTSEPSNITNVSNTHCRPPASWLQTTISSQ